MLDAVNASVTVLAEIGADDDTGESDVSIEDLNKILPVLADINESNEAAYQAYIADPANPFSAPATQAEVQAMITAVNASVDTENAASKTVLTEIGEDDDAEASDVTIADLKTISPALTDVNASNEAAYQAYIADPANAFSAPATWQEVQDMITVIENKPNYLPILIVEGGTISGSEGNITITIKITEKNGVSNKDDVKFRIPKNSKIIFDTFSSALKTLNGQTLENDKWDIVDNKPDNPSRGYYTFTYTGNAGKFPMSSSSALGITAVFRTPIGSKGTFGMAAIILGGPDEDSTSKNNTDSDTIRFEY
jgi:hypothetical protein